MIRSFFSDLVKLTGCFCAIIIFLSTQWKDCLNFLVTNGILTLSTEGVAISPFSAISFYLKLSMVLFTAAFLGTGWGIFKGYIEWANDFNLLIIIWLLAGTVILYTLSLPATWFQLISILLCLYGYVWISLKVIWGFLKQAI
jgi:uncharacterized membrane protein YjjP (DUF1212 family)